MDNKEAIKIINQYDMNFHWNDGEPIPAEQLVEAFDLAIAALEQQEKAFDEWCTDCKEYDKERHCCPRFSKVIRGALDEVKQQGWIPVSKKPKSGTDVLLQFEKNMAVGFYSWGDWNVNSGNGFYTGLTASEDQPIAWMPLPEAISGGQSMSRLDKAIADVAYILDCLMAYRNIVSTGNCNNCKNKDCGCKPKPGQLVRYNCPHYEAEEEA